MANFRSYKSDWRGVVGLIPPIPHTGPLEELIRLLPEGVGVLPLYLGIKEGTEQELFDALAPTKEKIAELAKLGVDLIHPMGAPIFMFRGYKGEKKIVKELEDQYGIPLFTSGMSQVEALKALGIKRMLGITYRGEKESGINQKYADYFTEAGFEVLGMDGISVPFHEVPRLSSQEVYAFTKRQFLKHNGVDGIYMIGSLWRILDITQTLEDDLQVPVVQAVPARAWAIQKRLHIRQPIKGYGRLLEQLP